jgi:hypothetical protein
MMLVQYVNGRETETPMEWFPVGEYGLPCLLYPGAKVRLTLTKGGVWPAVIDSAQRDFIVTMAEGGRRGVRFEREDVAKIELGW